MATVHIPPQLVRFTDGARQVEIPGTTLREIVDALDKRFPGIRDCLIEEERMRPGMNAAVDSVVHPTGLRTPVAPESEVHFIPAISGGSGGRVGKERRR